MQFMSGVTMPLPTSHDFYIADSACGDGKTTIIKKIAEQMQSSGVLIVTQTTEAADRVFNDLSRTIPTENIGLLHSQKKAESYLAEHRENPQYLWKYPILITTAVRLQHYPTELFIQMDILGRRYREYILIDEIISFFPEYPIDVKSLLPSISFMSSSKHLKNGSLHQKVITETKKMYQYLYKDTLLMESGIRSDKSQRDLFKNPLAAYRTKGILKHIVNNGLTLIPFNVDILSANSTVILFDGTADVLFPNDARLLSGGLSAKYSSDISFYQYHIPFRRRNDKDWDIEQLKIQGMTLFSQIANRTLTEKILIVTWKDIERKIKRVDTDKLEEKEFYNFPDSISQILDELGANRDNYGVIYRGSGLERGCNEYRDFESIYFIGEWHISDDISPKLNDVFKGKTTMKDYKKSLLIQSICRLRIRQHLGLPIKVFFSDDMDYNLMYEVQKYFKVNSTLGCKITGVQEPLPRMNRHEKNHFFDISILSYVYPQILKGILARTPVSVSIPKSELFKILPKDRRSTDRYKSLISHLQSQEITISITDS